jgi:hypothetical protein
MKPKNMPITPQQLAPPLNTVTIYQNDVTDNASRETRKFQGERATLAHKLLEEWPSMATFGHDVNYMIRLKENSQDLSEYPMQLERNRGLLRVWGVGEGQNSNDEAHSLGNPEGVDDSDTCSPALDRERLWGYPPVDRSSPSIKITNAGGPGSHPSLNNGSGIAGKLNFDPLVLWRLYKSYLTNMHHLQPFMDPSKIKTMIERFIERYSTDVKSSSAALSATDSVVSLSSHGIKRKRSGSAFGEAYSSKVPIERSLQNSIVLLILALGEVCEYKVRLPSPQTDKSTAMNGGWDLHKSLRTNVSISGDTADDYCVRNIDILPGMEYFAHATDILGNHLAGNTLAHAHATILASLYLSQFARVIESWNWVDNACRIITVLVKA